MNQWIERIDLYHQDKCDQLEKFWESESAEIDIAIERQHREVASLNTLSSKLSRIVALKTLSTMLTDGIGCVEPEAPLGDTSSLGKDELQAVEDRRLEVEKELEMIEHRARSLDISVDLTSKWSNHLRQQHRLSEEIEQDVLRNSDRCSLIRTSLGYVGMADARVAAERCRLHCPRCQSTLDLSSNRYRSIEVSGACVLLWIHTWSDSSFAAAGKGTMQGSRIGFMGRSLCHGGGR